VAAAALFDYRARDASGREHKGVAAGESSTAVAKDLAGRGWVPVDIKRKAGRGPAAAAPSKAAAGPAPPAEDGTVASPSLNLSLPRLGGPSKKRLQMSFGMVLRELAALLRAGVPLMRALHLSGDSAVDLPVREAMQRISRDLDNGHNLVKAAEHEHRKSGLITPYDLAMLQVGEQTGRLPEALSELHRHREFTRQTGEQVSAALRYPAFVILTCLLAVVVVNIFVIPAFARVFEQSRTPLPLLTLVLLGMSNFMIKAWPLLLAAVAGLIFAWQRWLATPSGRLRWDRVKLRLPVVGPILESIVLSRLSASLASSLGAGLTLSESLNVTARTLDNQWYETRLKQMVTDLARGSSIAGAARNMNLLPPTMLQLFAIGEESGSLEQLMREISVHHQSNVDFSVKRLSGTLEPILIWFLGMGVLVLALGVFMPMWDLGQASIK
jgi:MSHA biogenesis protein MshG